MSSREWRYSRCRHLVAFADYLHEDVFEAHTVSPGEKPSNGALRNERSMVHDHHVGAGLLDLRYKSGACLARGFGALRFLSAAEPPRWLAGSASISSSRRAVPQPPAPPTSGAARGAAPGMLSVSHAWERSKLSEQSSGMLSVSLAHLDQRFLRSAPC